MSTKTILLRRDTEARWDEADPVLGYLEAGCTTDSLGMKVGDGIRPWSALEWTLPPDPTEYRPWIEEGLTLIGLWP